MSTEISPVEVRINKHEATASKALFRDNYLIFEAFPLGKEYLSFPLDSFETTWRRSLKKQEIPLITSAIIFFFFSFLWRYVHTNDPIFRHIVGFLFVIYFLVFFVVMPPAGFIAGFTWVFLLLTYIKNKEIILLTRKGEFRISGEKHILKTLETEINRRKSEYRSN